MLEDQHMSVQEAAAVVEDARARARRELVICAPLVYAAWGLTLLLGYGAMWLSVRGEHPYTGPSGGSIAVVLALAALAVAAVVVIVSNAKQPSTMKSPCAILMISSSPKMTERPRAIRAMIRPQIT